MDDILFLKEYLQKLETMVLPTLVKRWVSLHPSFGLVCWSDDDELKQHFQNCIDVDFIKFGTLSSEDKQILHGRVAALMKSLGIPALSKVIYFLFSDIFIDFFPTLCNAGNVVCNSSFSCEVVQSNTD